MLQLSHILVLSQPELIRRQVDFALESPTARRWWRRG